ncbi:MAG: hypothetical protein CBC13_07635 [Planctomycetia bacterium TMED53]|nr:MAG: hypothetical protein CBC13_07635 [Planctomycetia bacterium TMED53]
MNNQGMMCLVALLFIFSGADLLAQPGSIVTQSRTVPIDDVNLTGVVDELVINQVTANQVMNKLVGKWNFEYALSEELSGFPIGTPVKATVSYRRDFNTGGLFGTAETITFDNAAVSSGTYFIQWNENKNRLESHGYFVAGEKISVFDEYLDAVVGDTFRWIGQAKEEGIAGSNVLIERTIKNGNFNVVISEVNVNGSPLNQIWNVTGIKVNPLKEALGPFVALASEWQSDNFTAAGERLRVEQSGYWAANETCLVVETKKYKQDLLKESSIQTFYYDVEKCRIAYTEIGSNGLVCNGFISPYTERNGTPCQLRVLDAEYGNGAVVSTINKMLLIDSKTIKVDFEWAWWEGEDITRETAVQEFEQKFVLKRVPAEGQAAPRPASF